MAASRSSSTRSPCKYEPPDWARGLRVQPTSRLALAQLPTPIHRWQLPGVPDQFEVCIKRDDLTGATLSGNKVRKLEFVFAEAVEQGCDSIITLGLLQSNHARATSVIARQFGMEPHLILFANESEIHEGPQAVAASGNLMVDRLMGAKIFLTPIPKIGENAATWKRLLNKYSAELKKEGMHPYTLTAGGASLIGCWGYIEAWREMMEQGILDKFTDVVVCAATCGTLVGLAIGNYLTGSKLKIHGVNIGLSEEEAWSHMNSELEGVGLLGDDRAPVRADQILDLIVEYMGKYSEEERDLILDASLKTGIILDQVFTAKAAHGMLCEMKTNPSRFKGEKILFIHTGGLLGVLGGAMSDYLRSTQSSNQIYRYSDVVVSSECTN